MRKPKSIIQLLSFLIFIACTLYVAGYFYENFSSERKIEKLRQEIEERNKIPSDTEKYAANGMLDEYYELYKRNNDMVGWIKIEDTKIDYPVMYNNSNNTAYLHKSFEKEYQYCGLPFMDKDCSLSPRNDNIIIYAHNMRNGTMFADLINYSDNDFLAAHREVEFDTLYEREKYQIISIFRTQVGSSNEFKYFNFITASDEEQFNQFITKAKALSMVKLDETAAYGDKLLTLSTCSYNKRNERTVVIAKKI